MVFNKCFYELVEVSEVYLLVCFVSNSWCISCPLTLTSWPSLEVFPLFGSTFNLRLLMPTLPKKEEVKLIHEGCLPGQLLPYRLNPPCLGEMEEGTAAISQALGIQGLNPPLPPSLSNCSTFLSLHLLIDIMVIHTPILKGSCNCFSYFHKLLALVDSCKILMLFLLHIIQNPYLWDCLRMGWEEGSTFHNPTCIPISAGECSQTDSILPKSWISSLFLCRQKHSLRDTTWLIIAFFWEEVNKGIA